MISAWPHQGAVGSASMPFLLLAFYLRPVPHWTPAAQLASAAAPSAELKQVITLFCFQLVS